MYNPYKKGTSLHGAASERAQGRLQEVKDFLPGQEIWFKQINTVSGAYIGSGVVDFACIAKKQAKEEHELDCKDSDIFHPTLSAELI